ncbi:uncharacterized protein BO97DRAFT_440855 [Aspergillus homomorphus CBS 101889]|uniref:Uncharacterized protein n=1 Tax=Aspergillus homomorphus (strain CBS 101889) TaxID=1450537 RepID=A0A395I5H0_ASPHC|nr:hypothetical protein BO97DRAFT_440855 [Aspergillus homomorphus CBS 101889]RAL15451.1 hypothetical protein BO97DRAFT_440855 [Aspergillus homomorphus CBS 101889]
MRQERLNDAAIALCGALDTAGIKGGCIGGYAIGLLGSGRQTNDIDCFVSSSKAMIVALLDGYNGFTNIPRGREDYAAFMWCNTTDQSEPVLVKVFCERFPRFRYTMDHTFPRVTLVRGESFGVGVIHYLDPYNIFKGKLRAAATRSEVNDAADLHWLASQYGIIRSRAHELNLDYVGLAIKRYPDLEELFEQLSVDVVQAKENMHDVELYELPLLGPGDVQRGLLA